VLRDIARYDAYTAALEVGGVTEQIGGRGAAHSDRTSREDWRCSYDQEAQIASPNAHVTDVVDRDIVFIKTGQQRPLVEEFLDSAIKQIEAETKDGKTFNAKKMEGFSSSYNAYSWKNMTVEPSVNGPRTA